MRRPKVTQPAGCRQNPTWRSWRKMIERCYYPYEKAYHQYGGRGIKVCKRWWVFENFEADMGPRPEGMTLDRKDSNKGYSPENCQWASKGIQGENTRLRTNKFKGVSFDRSLKIWIGIITVSGKKYRVRGRRGDSEQSVARRLTALRFQLEDKYPAHWQTVQGRTKK